MYGITRELGFDEQAASLCGSVVVSDALIEPLEWILRRDPYVGTPVRDSAVRVLVTAGTPPLLILYLVDEVTQQVLLRWVDQGVAPLG